ncbi:hypothetical protein J2X97_001558 [Epilithonimonas hungarica]|nr:hypothetical protein [Epilithonimonas hungarica]
MKYLLQRRPFISKQKINFEHASSDALIKDTYEAIDTES